MAIRFSSSGNVPTLPNIVLATPNLPGGSSYTLLLDDLGDVTLGTLARGDVLTWTGNRWANRAGGGGDIALEDLTDVVITDVMLGDVLTWNGEDWVNLPGGGGAETLEDLLDVQITDRQIYDFLGWDGTYWVNAMAELSILSDVDLDDPQNGQLLVYRQVDDEPGVWVNSNLDGSVGQVAGWVQNGFYDVLGPLGLSYTTSADNTAVGLFSPQISGPYPTLGTNDVAIGWFPSYTSTGGGIVIGNNVTATAVGSSVLIGDNSTDNGTANQTVVGANAGGMTPGGIILGNAAVGYQSNSGFVLGLNSGSVNSAYGNDADAAPGLMYLNVEAFVGSDNPGSGQLYQYYLPLVGPVPNFSSSPLVCFPPMMTNLIGFGGAPLPTSSTFTVSWASIGRNDLSWSISGAGNSVVTVNNTGLYVIELSGRIANLSTDTWSWMVMNLTYLPSTTIPLMMIPRGSAAAVTLGGLNATGYSFRRLFNFVSGTQFTLTGAIDGSNGVNQPTSWITLWADYRGP